MKISRKQPTIATPRQKHYLTPPAHLPGSPAHYESCRSFTQRLHNRRISVLITPTGEYQISMAKALRPGEAAEIRRLGHHDTIGDYILRDRVRYSVLVLSAEAFEAVMWCGEQVKARQQRKR